MSQMMAKAVCAEISNEVVKLVPQLDDYLCPVCFSITYKPIRLNCGHIFCIRCMIQMQKARAKYCPLCRNDVIMDADSGIFILATHPC
jgi:E3 ubiquitin-protein ligase BAH